MHLCPIAACLSPPTPPAPPQEKNYELPLKTMLQILKARNNSEGRKERETEIMIIKKIIITQAIKSSKSRWHGKEKKNEVMRINDRKRPTETNKENENETYQVNVCTCVCVSSSVVST